MKKSSKRMIEEFSFTVDEEGKGCYLSQVHIDREDIVIPDSHLGLSVVGIFAVFKENLKTVTIPRGVRILSGFSFMQCKRLESILVDKDNTAFQSIEGNLYSKDRKTLMRYAVGKKQSAFIIPNEVTTIAEHAFSASENLQTVVIPKSVEVIEGFVFESYRTLFILAEADEKPQGWRKQWLLPTTVGDSRVSVAWGHKGEC